MTDPFSDIQASLFAFCSSFCQDMAAAGVATPQVFKFDAHADINEFPEADIVGISSFGIDNDEGLVTSSFILGISTIDDENTFRLDKMIGLALKRVKPGALIELKDANTGQRYGTLKVLGTQRVMPVEATKIRPLRGIALTVASDHAWTLAS